MEKSNQYEKQIFRRAELKAQIQLTQTLIQVNRQRLEFHELELTQLYDATQHLNQLILDFDEHSS